LPAVGLLVVVFAYPLAVIVLRSFTEPAVGLQNYTPLLSDGITVIVILRTLRIALVVAVATLIIAYPYAYTMTVVGPRMRNLLIVAVMLPFWTSVMARNFAWFMLMQRRGPIDSIFSFFGIDNVVLLRTETGVLISMIQVLLPFMVLPLYSSLSTIDRRLLLAASSLGGTKLNVFFRIYLPLSVPGIVAGVSLVFITALGFYVTPAVLGTPQQALISQLIALRINELLDFGGAGAVATVVLVLTLLLLWIARKFTSAQEGQNWRSR
jgi:putative spermidine/putrescine transport system permease protein